MRTAKRLVAFLAVGAMALPACDGETKTEVVTVPEVAACSGAYPYGACDAGETCVDGTCVATDTLCSPTNPTGDCASGRTCLAGGCVLESALCSSTTPGGLCNVDETCLEGTCVTNTSICSPSNPVGLCPTGYACTNGVCAESDIPGPGFCDEQVYTTQPTIAVQSGATPPAAVDPAALATYTDFTWDGPKQVLTVDGLQFKDSSGNGVLDPYEDWRLHEICRARDLVSKMSLEEKIGLMHESSDIGGGTSDGSLPSNILGNLITLHRRYALMRVGQRSGAELAVYVNNLQEFLEGFGWGIPETITADPIHGARMSTSATTGNQSLSSTFPVSDWPIPLGIGAINDPQLSREFGDTVRQEFMAMGLRWQLGPMADSATEPRWERVQNTFGANPLAVQYQVREVISGFQAVGDGGLRNGIAATMKHFPGAGANEDGMDSHSYPGRYNVYPGGYFEQHLMPFQAAVDVGVAAVMPCYSIFKGQLDYSPLQVGAGFSPGLITETLKKNMGFNGMVTGDWGALGQGYNTESLTTTQRAAMWVEAGSHQLGLDSEAAFLDALDAGYLVEDQIDAAVEKILEMTFKLGLFENPYVDESAVGTIVRSTENLTKGFNAMKRAIVMLDNRPHEFPPAATGWFAPPDPAPPILPLRGTIEEAQRCAAGSTQNEGRVCVDDDFCGGGTDSCTDVGGYAVNDWDLDGTVRVYFDGIDDNIVVAAPTDPMAGVLGGYDYTSTGDGTTTIDVVEVTDITQADIAVLRIAARRGTYFGLDAGVPLSFDGPFPGTQSEGSLGASTRDRNRVLDALRVRDGYTDADGNAVAASNPNLRIVLVMYMDRPGIVEPFIQGMATLDEALGEPGSYPLVSDVANHDPQGDAGVDAFLVDFGATDRALLDVLFDVHHNGVEYLQARLPMELPSSDEAVEAQYEDLPADSLNPTFTIGSGRSY